MTQDTLDEAIEFVESVSEPPLVTINTKTMKNRLWSKGHYVSLQSINKSVHAINSYARGGYMHKGNLITFFKRFDETLDEALKTINHEYLHYTISVIGEPEASQLMDKKYGLAEKEEEYGI